MKSKYFEHKRQNNIIFWQFFLQHVDINVVAVINDAVGTLMSAAHSDRNCEIGLILGELNFNFFSYQHKNISISTRKWQKMTVNPISQS